jgi:hypothetical protein
MNFVSARRDPRLIAAVVSASIVLAFVAVFAFAARAQATETIFWDNYTADPDNVAFADINGSGGGVLNIGTESIVGPEGMAYDTATNRLFVANEAGAKGQILAINLSGGATPFTAPGAPIEEPEGVAVDPTRRTIYWLNTEASTISWANLDGSAGGTLNLAGATVNSPCCRIAVDPIGGRVYWVNEGTSPNVLSYANLDNSGGGNLSLTGSTVEPGGEGLSVDNAGGRIYFIGGTNEVGYANLNGSGGGDVNTTGGVINGPWGLALDPTIGRLYLGNYSNSETRTNAIGFVNLAGGGGGITPAAAPVDGPQDPLILKSPSGTGAPTVTVSSSNPAALSCSEGSWAADYPGSFVYQAPRSLGYQWLLNGASIAGATSNTLTATAAGAYTCSVTATNQTGTATQTSGAAATVKAASIKLTVKKKTVKAKAGKLATLSVKALNQGGLPGAPRVCVKVPKKAKKALKAPKCKSLGTVAALAEKTTKLKVKLKPAAEGKYKVKIQVKGVPGNAINATIKVIG